MSFWYAGAMSTHDRTSIIVGIIIVIVLVLGFLAWQERAGTQASIPSTATTTSATSSSGGNVISISPSGKVTGPAGYTITEIPVGSDAPQAPNYKAPLVFASTVPADQQAQLQQAFAAAQATITKSPQDFNSWIELGLVRKEAGDYTGAAADWQYMSALYPTNVVSNANLGDLYTNYLPNYPKAAAAFKAQIANDPTDEYIYIDLYDLYTTHYPQSSSTIVALLKQGLAAVPGDAQLSALLAKYQ